jgi:hypothetical protein
MFQQRAVHAYRNALCPHGWRECEWAACKMAVVEEASVCPMPPGFDRVARPITMADEQEVSAKVGCGRQVGTVRDGNQNPSDAVRGSIGRHRLRLQQEIGASGLGQSDPTDVAQDVWHLCQVGIRERQYRPCFESLPGTLGR